MSDSKLPVKKTRYQPLKNGLWAKNLSKGVDKRTQIGRWIERLKSELVRHVGTPSICEMVLIERICSKVVRCRLYEAGLFAKEPMGSRDHFLALENGLRHDLISLGLQRRARKITNLEDYLKNKEQGGNPL
jgi:hypothetical protein